MPKLAGRFGPSPAEMAERIRCERDRLGISQAEAARKLGIARATYKQLEVVANPQACTLVALVQELGMRFDSLLPEVLYGTKGSTHRKESTSANDQR